MPDAEESIATMGSPLRSFTVGAEASRRAGHRLPTFSIAVAAICLIGWLVPAEASPAGKGPPKKASPATSAPNELISLSEALRIGPLQDPDAPSSLAAIFVPGQLIVRFDPSVGSRVHSALEEGLAPSMPGDAAAAELDQLLRRHKSKGMRRVFKVYEDADGRQIDTARAQLRRNRRARQNLSSRRLPPLPARTPDLESFFLVEMPGLETSRELDAVMAELRANDLVVDVQPNFVHRLLAEPLPAAAVIPNDPYVSIDGATWSEGSFGNAFPDLYGVRNLHALEAWSLLDTNGNGVFDADETAPGEGVVVAVIDTGLDTAHPDIAGSVFVNPGEIPGDGIDNDGNLLVDDVSGWDFVDHDPIPEDRSGHGTHVAGTIAARSNNAEGIVGIAPFARILPIKGIGDQGFGSSTDLAAAVTYAAGVGAHITSNSWGSLFVDPLLQAAFDHAEASGVLSFAAAGNSARPFVAMPALFGSVVAVAAVDDVDTLASFSNWGGGLDLCAPGVSVLSLSANGHDNILADLSGHVLADDYLWLSGTSMATPHVSGVAALTMSIHPDESAAETRGRLLKAAVSIESQNPGREGGLGAGRVDALSSATADPAPLLSPVAIRAGAIVAGERVSIDVEVRNLWAPASGVHASLASADPGVSIVDGEGDYGDLETGESASRSFEIEIAPEVGFDEELGLLLTIGADGVSSQEHPFSVRGSFFENKDHLADLGPFPLLVTGATFGDFDGDELQDMGIGSFFARTRLYQQTPGGTFDVREPAGSGSMRFPIFADMNDDGLLDMLAVGPTAALAINVGGGQFELLPESSGFAFPERSLITGFTPIDLDADGDLDVVAGVHAFFKDDQGTFRNIVVLRNDGDLTFSDAWAETGFSRLRGAHQYLALDWNGDGFQDLLGLNRYWNRVSLHRNLGKGRFEDVTDIAFPDDLLLCPDWWDGICDFFWTAAAGDHDNDGDTDLVLTTSGNIGSENRSAAMLLANDGNGVYSDVTDGAGDLATVTMLTGRRGTSFFDLENDGDLDIVIPIDILLAGTPSRTPEGKIVVLRNDGNGHFSHVSDMALPPDTPVASSILAVGDFDRDGAQDILAPVGPFIGEVGGLMRNVAGGDRAWLEVQLDEVDSAPDGYGARVTLVADDRVQTREVLHSPVEPWWVHFGLGDAAMVSVLEIRWPSGIVGIQRDVAVDQRLIVREDIPCPGLQGGQCPTVEIDIDPSSEDNEVSLRSNGLLSVAILGSDGFDVSSIDVTRTFFASGRTRAVHKAGGHVEDVNGDGLLDFKSHFHVPETGIEAGDVEACLRGQMLDRTPFTGCDRISITGTGKDKDKGTK